MKKVEEDLAVDLFFNEEGCRYAYLIVYLGADVALFYRNFEWPEHVFYDLNEFGAGALNIVYLLDVFLDQHLRELGLNVVFEQFTRTPNDLHGIILLLTEGFIVKEHF